MLSEFRCDLHIHTCLSPCAELDMHPAAVVDKAVERCLDVIAICDHNASENVEYVMRAAQHKPLRIIPGMEITTSEEVHILALFDDTDDLERLQTIVYDRLPGRNDERLFGCQAIVNEKGEVEGINERLLIGATDISLNEIVKRIHALGGLAVASHIDRESFSVISQLGFIDKHSGLDALEISGLLGIGGGREKYPELSDWPFLTSSDAHFLHDVGSTTTAMYLARGTFDEVKMAIEHREGRRIVG